MKQPTIRIQVISQHAIARYQERVDQTASPSQARHAITDIVTHGRNRPNPRHWMNDARHEPGTTFVHWAQRPTICAVMRQGIVVTILTRQLVRQISPRDHYTQPKARRSPRMIDFNHAAMTNADELEWEDLS